MVVRIADMIPGHKMCCICFEYIPFDDLYVDRDGQKWDMCRPCAAHEEICKAMKAQGYDRDEIIQFLRDLTRFGQPVRMEP